MLSVDGEVIVTLCKGQGGTPLDQPMREKHDTWQVVAMATYAGLILSKAELFCAEDYPEYSSTGFRSQDKSFHTKDGVVHVFTRPDIGSDADADLEADKAPTQHNIKMAVLPFSVAGESGEYIKNKLSRRVMTEEGNPVKIAYLRLLEQLQRSREELSTFPLDSTENMLVRCETNCEKDCQYAAYYNLPQGGDGISKCGDMSTSSETQGYITNCSYGTKQGTLQAQCRVLRTNILDQLPDLSTLFKSGIINVFSGAVCHREPVAEFQLPVGHQTALVCDKLGVVPATVKSIIQKLCSSSDDQSIHVGRYDPAQHLCSCMLGRFDRADDMTVISLTIGGSTSVVSYMGVARLDGRTFDVAVIELDILAQFLFKIPDRRLLWTEDQRFYGLLHERKGSVPQVSLYPPVYSHDMSFWAGEHCHFEENELQMHDITRGIAGDFIKSVSLLDKYQCVETGRRSLCYRMIFQSCDQPLSYHQSHDLQKAIRLRVAEVLRVTLR